MSALRKFTLLLKNPQNWIDAIFVLTVLGLGTGLFENEDRATERIAAPPDNAQLADMALAELSPQGPPHELAPCTPCASR